MALAHVLVEVAGANMTTHIDGGHANEVELRSENALDGAPLIPRSPRGCSFSPPWGGHFGCHKVEGCGVGS
jgi:hypothetical protein